MKTSRAKKGSLALWMNGVFVGTWSMGANQPEILTYADSWLANDAARPLSLSLPFTPGNQPHRGDVVNSYFENLLPDNKEIRERAARRYQTGSIDAFALLTEIGRDCVGALQLLPSNVEAAGLQPINVTPLTDAEVAQLLRDTLAPAAIAGGRDDGDDEEFRISIAGAQEKTALVRYQDRWCLPHQHTPTTHIFKLPLGLVAGLQLDMRDSIENEWLCSLILREFGLPVAHCEPWQFEDMKVLAVERFDRQWWNGPNGATIIRLPQEDMCQATGLSPLLKYEADGGPGIDRIIELLNMSMNRDEDRRVFFQAQVLFWMLCATDGHAKNFSIFLRPGGRFQLTPLYDVLSVYPWLGAGPGKLSPHKARMAMAVRATNPHRKMKEILRRHWLAVGERHGISTPDGEGTFAVLDDLVDRTPQVIAAVRAQLPNGFPQYVADSILGGLQDAANRLRASA